MFEKHFYRAPVNLDVYKKGKGVRNENFMGTIPARELFYLVQRCDDENDYDHPTGPPKPPRFLVIYKELIGDVTLAGDYIYTPVDVE